jgi:hypothetical protein
MDGAQVAAGSPWPLMLAVLVFWAWPIFTFLQFVLFLVLHPSEDFLVCLANGENQADYVTGSNLIGGLLYLHYCFASGLTWKHPLFTRLLEKRKQN